MVQYYDRCNEYLNKEIYVIYYAINDVSPYFLCLVLLNILHIPHML